jgi:hypothetical protein
MLQLEEKPDEWRRRIAYVSGQWRNPAAGDLFISYGCADKTARILKISAADIGTFFRPPASLPSRLERSEEHIAPSAQSQQGEQTATQQMLKLQSK